jgi:allantoicase
MTVNADKPFHEWIQLEQSRLGTRVVYATDDFFAAKERLIDAADAVFIADKYDEHGKWMDGWESRRKRTAGHDYCIIRLGIPGVVHGFDIDTSHFTGNYPPAASIDACVSQADIPADDANWQQLLPRMQLDGDAHHFVPLAEGVAVTHLRLNIYPDGGVARLRIYGEVTPEWSSVEPDLRMDLFAIENGGRAIYCNDEHFGSMHNLNLAGRGVNMGDGWETARRRRPGNDWVVLALGHPGKIEEIEIDTLHFKGNYPDRVELRAALLTDGDDLITGSEEWAVLLPESKLEMDRQHLFSATLQDVGVVSHVRMNIFPDGGISRLRLYGKIAAGEHSS